MYLIIDKEKDHCVGIGNNLTDLRDSCARVLALEQARVAREKYVIQFTDDKTIVTMGSMDEVLNNG